MATLTLRNGIAFPGGTIEVDEDYTVEAYEVSDEISVANGTTDQELPLTIDVSQVGVLFFIATVAMTLETNDGTTPTHTLSLQANKPYRFRTSDYNASLIASTNVTVAYITNASGAAGTLRWIRGYADATP